MSADPPATAAPQITGERTDPATAAAVTVAVEAHTVAQNMQETR